MKTPREIYAHYKIMPSLQLHQLRVAAVAQILCDNLGEPVQKREVMLAALFHDMGNIVKFDLTYFPESVLPEGLEYWQTVKSGYIQKYGSDSHVVSAAIGRELGFSEIIIGDIESIGFSSVRDTVTGGSLKRKILQYGDLRVGPHGILSCVERLYDARGRYPKYKETLIYDSVIQAAQDLERQLFSGVMMRPEDITDSSVRPIVEELWEYPVA